MGIGPVPATEKLLARNNLTMDDIGLIEINEAFAVQVLAFLDHFKIDADDPRVNPWGGAIALGHPLASSGVRLMIQLAAQFADPPRGPLRHGDHVRRHGHGRHRLVGADLKNANAHIERTRASPSSAPLISQPKETAGDDGNREPVGRAGRGRVPRRGGDPRDRPRRRPRRRRPARADHPGQRPRPHQAEHVRPAGAALAQRGPRRRRRPRGGGRDRRRRRDRQAVHPRGRRRPGRRGRGDHRPRHRPGGGAGAGGRHRGARPRGLPPAGRAAGAVVLLHQRGRARRRARGRAALHLPDDLLRGADGRLPRVLPRPGPRLGRRLPAAPADRPGPRAEADHREPAQPEQDDRRGRGVLARHRRRDVRTGRLPRGVAPLGGPGPGRLGHGRAGPAGRRGHLGRRRRRHPVPHRRQAARRRPRPVPGARPGRGRPDRHPRRRVRGRGPGPGRPPAVGRAPGRAVRLRPGAEARQAARRGARPGPRQEGHQGRRRRRRADGRPDRAAVRPPPAGPGRDDRPGPGPGGLRRGLRARRDRQAAGPRPALAPTPPTGRRR